MKIIYVDGQEMLWCPECRPVYEPFRAAIPGWGDSPLQSPEEKTYTDNHSRRHSFLELALEPQ